MDGVEAFDVNPGEDLSFEEGEEFWGLSPPRRGFGDVLVEPSQREHVRSHLDSDLTFLDRAFASEDFEAEAEPSSSLRSNAFDARRAGERPGHSVPIVDREEVIRLVRAVSPSFMVDDDDDCPFGSARPELTESAAMLERHLQKPLLRRQLFGTEELVLDLADLGREMPNMASAVEVVTRSVFLSLFTGTPLRIPPILLVGPPGTGKTRFVKRLAGILKTSVSAIDGSSLRDPTPISGYSEAWKGAKPGGVATALLEGSTASPLIFIDEFDKAPDTSDRHWGSAHAALLPLLEPSTSGRFVDDFYGVPFRADGVIWVFTANDADGFSRPFLDRVLSVYVRPLDDVETWRALDLMLREILEGIAADGGVQFDVEIADDAYVLLSSEGLRSARRMMLLALSDVFAYRYLGAEAATSGLMLTRSSVLSAHSLMSSCRKPDVVFGFGRR